MTFAFDLISDLHDETWPDPFDWKGIATSPYCVIAGDVGRDRQKVIEILSWAGQNYQAVFYIDGNDEHRDHWQKLAWSFQDLKSQIKHLPNVIYLQDHVVVINGVAILGTNAWWDFNFGSVDPVEAEAQWQQNFRDHGTLDANGMIARSLCEQDRAYLQSSVARLQTHLDVKRIVIVTHTVPWQQLIDHDPVLNSNWRMNVQGSNIVPSIQAVDTEKKVHTWCFGHYHGSVDRIIDGVRFVNNCRGRGNTEWKKHVYFPARIEIEF